MYKGNMDNVTFLNEPKLSGHSVNQEQDDRRTNLVPQIESFLTTHELFKGSSVSVTFFQAGASGLVSLLETETEKYVLKTLLRPDGPKGEVEFLRAWEAAGVRVPHVYEVGMIGEHPYILMEYVNAKALEHFPESELLEQKIFTQMGQILRHIHTTTAKGYGRMKEDGAAEYEDFKTWLFEFQQTKNQISYTQKYDLLPSDAFGTIDEARGILVDFVSDNPQSTYCHWDFAPGNILCSEPLTVFDPVPTFNHPYLDIARSIVQTIGAGYISAEVSEQLIEGYFSDNTQKVNEKVLYAATLFIAYTKMPYWHKTNEELILKNLSNYLIEHKAI
jgi:fructosamine-3-kinase